MNNLINAFTQLALDKKHHINNDLSGFFTGCLLAGAYVGIGIILMITVATPVPEAYQTMVLAITFGIALTLVIIAGSELFTGYSLYMTVALLRKKSLI